mgnify:CR=1 FL=1
MTTLKNQIASFFYYLAELSEVPLRYVLNDIFGRWMTVLTPNEYGNASSKTAEIFIRIGLGFLFILLIGPVIITSLLWVLLRFIGDIWLWSQQFLLFKGNYSGSGNNTFATWNLASFLPPCTIVDGVAYSNERLKQIGDQIKDFHFFCGQEVGGPEARFLSKHLQDNYMEFYSYIGKSHTPLLQSGLFFASKEAVLNVDWYPYAKKTGRQASIHRGFVVFELQNYYVVVTHPDSAQTSAGITTRNLEIQQLLGDIAEYKDKPIIFCADLNSDRYQNEPGYQLLTAQFPDVILNQYQTCNNCSDLTDHPYCPGADKIGGATNIACITDTDILAYNRFNKSGKIECISIDFFGTNSTTFKVNLTGSAFFLDLTDHHLMKGEIS